MYNIIVCDFDGVLTSIESGTSFFCMDDLTYKPCLKLVERLKKLCDKTNSKIMLSSNWRHYDKDATYVYRNIVFKNQMPKLRKMLKNYLIEDLPYIQNTSKAECLSEWLDKHMEYENKYVVVDDMDIGFKKKRKHKINKRTVLTDYQIGLSEDDCKKIEKILQNDI